MDTKYSFESLSNYVPVTRANDALITNAIENDTLLPLIKKNPQKLVLLKLPTTLISKELPSTINLNNLNPSDNDSIQMKVEKDCISSKCMIANTIFDESREAFHLLVSSKVPNGKDEPLSIINGPSFDNIWTFSVDLKLPSDTWTIDSLQKSFDSYFHKNNSITQPSGLKFRCFPPGCHIY